MKLHNMTSSEITALFEAACPGAHDAVQAALAATMRGKQEVYVYQAYVLYFLAQKYNWRGARILEIGTYWGFSAAVMAQAAPQAELVTLNPTTWEYEQAVKNLARLRNVAVKCIKSSDYLASDPGEFDLVFIDGDHKRVRQDFPFWERIRPGGLMLFHDYSHKDSRRPCPAVYEALNEWRLERGEFDVIVVDDGGAGMAGWYKP